MDFYFCSTFYSPFGEGLVVLPLSAIPELGEVASKARIALSGVPSVYLAYGIPRPGSVISGYACTRARLTTSVADSMSPGVSVYRTAEPCWGNTVVVLQR